MNPKRHLQIAGSDLAGGVCLLSALFDNQLQLTAMVCCMVGGTWSHMLETANRLEYTIDLGNLAPREECYYCNQKEIFLHGSPH